MLRKKLESPIIILIQELEKHLAGKAVVTISRGACTGCHNVVPPQRQIEIRGSKRLFTCESCGRLLISPNVAAEVKKG